MKFDIKQLTLDEKIRLLVGDGAWHIHTANGKLPHVFLSDGPNGLRMVDINSPNHEIKKATAMPNICLIASTWDTELAFLNGQTIADDCLEMGADVLLAPGVNMKRTPLCGRNFEYFSEDPFLAGTLAKAYIEGVQSKGVGTSLKHFCANNREYDRLLQSSDVDERTLREIYLPAFEIALEAKPWTVMCAYNPINGVYASENKWILKDILRDEFGFDGVIVSDWSATQCSWRALKASLDLTMPDHIHHVEVLKEAYEQGLITQEEIDASVERLLALIEKTQTLKGEITTTKEQRHENAVKIAREGMTLLKNEDNILPLTGGKILVAGEYTHSVALGGGGSALAQTAYEIRPLKDQIEERLGESVQIISGHGHVNCTSMHRAKDVFLDAYHADTVVLCLGTDKVVEAESYDRKTLRLNREQENYILEIAKVNKNVVVVLHSGCVVDMSPWIDKVKAVLWAGFGGEGAQEAIADILTGKACPCGKLAETFPMCLEDTPTADKCGNGFVDRYEEGLFIGYRWYDEKEKEVLFPFGHGLSYAKFEYSDLQIEKLGDTDYEVSYTIKNLSNVPAKEISQVYVKDVFAMVTRPQKELKGFNKVLLQPNESKRVSVKLNARSFAYYSIPQKSWVVESGDFEILVGASSRDIRLMGKIQIERPANEQTSQTLWH